MTKKLLPLNYFSEDIDYQEENGELISSWLLNCVQMEGFDIQAVNYILCSDEYLLQMNREHLKHDYYTDIITFDLTDREKVIEADIFISLDRVKENALTENVKFEEEYYRVLIHGLLHLMGYDDKSNEQKVTMREAEDKYLSLRPENS